ncbi:28S ribosomal protein S31, mitochondrial isoform X2 [Frieseomelitta varia]|uniref:28S ribosomal protein S31, mitochondrial isoform X2 n=1 Tax=Frieseomelitta varia TaxID=561572 RepID=UPI001CB68685|nr:28S ribosomal protein S31, mitochondrial isoform X2 [Frieseomelitta varia]
MYKYTIIHNKMLATFVFSKSIKTQITLPLQWLNITFNTLRTNSSFSSDSSDSDSDSDSTTSNKFSIDYLQSAKTVRKKRQIENALTQAAKALTTTSVQDKEKILSVLLNTIDKIQTVDKTLNESNIDKHEVRKEDESLWHQNNIETINNFKTKLHHNVSQFKEMKFNREELEKIYKTGKEPSIIHELKSQQKGTRDINDKSEREPSIVHKLKSQQKGIRDISSKFEREPSVIHELKSKRKEIKDITDKFEREPSIIHELKNQQKEIKNISGKFEREPSVIHELKNQQKGIKDISGKFEREPSVIHELKSRRKEIKDINDKFEREPSIIHELKNQQKGIKDISGKLEREPSVIHELKNQQKGIKDISGKLERKPSVIHELKSQQKGIKDISDGIQMNERLFDDFSENPDVPKFKMWESWEREELEFSLSKFPTNGIQQMIQWTKEGKLWKFPIDNEQGMEKEKNVHFSKHVFLERHLTPWCPKGPIRHFMELVCIGLSKNPYLTIEEKYDHIMWYKDYFQNKHDLLDKLGLLE